MSPSPKKLFDNLMKPFFGKRIKERKAEKDLQAIAATERKVFRYETLAAATGNFSPKQKLGAGGFGPVFKGRLEDGRDVAVKQLSQGSRQGTREFENEALLLSKVQHKNVVNLYGYCAHGDERLLVYEYVANESLDKILFSQTAEDERRKSRELDWQRRYQVALGVARGLLYLHEDAHIPIIHRDIKASNVLLDQRWVPKIADFGMARLYREEQTHVKTRVVGTNGYMAPEYVMQGHLSTKADVFSFGVLLLELVSGRKNSSFASLPDPEADSLLDWAWKLYRKGRSLNLMDPTLSSTADLEQVARCVQVALLCTQADHKLRPDMKRVGIILSKKPTALEEPTRPGTSSSRFWRGSYGTRYSGESSSASASASTAASTATTSTSRTATVHHTSIRPGTSSSRFSGESSSASASASTAASTATTSTSRTATVHHTSSQAQRPGRRG